MQEIPGIKVFVDHSYEEKSWKWEIDFHSKERILIVSRDIFEIMENGIIPEEIKNEMIIEQDGGNGSSL